jgi:hypothetical protein
LQSHRNASMTPLRRPHGLKCFYRNAERLRQFGVRQGLSVSKVHPQFVQRMMRVFGLPSASHASSFAVCFALSFT